MAGTVKLDYWSQSGRWHWRLVARNGRCLAQSVRADGYATKRGAQEAFRAATRALADDRYECTDGEPDCYVIVTWGRAGGGE